MADGDDEVTPPGWYRQPDDPTSLRWWDGDDWTDDTMPVPGGAREPRTARTRTRTGAPSGKDDGGAPADRGPRRTRADLMAAAEAEARGETPPDRTAEATAPVPIVVTSSTAVPAARGARSRKAPATPLPADGASAPEGDAGPPAVEILVEPTRDGDAGRPPTGRPTGPRRTGGGRSGPSPDQRDPSARGKGPRPTASGAGGSDGPGYRRSSTGTVRVMGDDDWPQQERRSLRAADADWVASTWDPEPGTKPPAKRAPRPTPGPVRRSGPTAQRAPGPRRPGPDDRRPAARSARGARTRDDEPTVGPPQLGKVLVRAAIIAVLLGVGYLGYVRLRDAAPSHARTLSEEPAAVTVDPDAPRLDQIVLTLADLPRGWSAATADASGEDICDGRVPRSVIKPTDLKSGSFTLGDTGSIIGNVVQEFSNVETAQAFMDLTADVVEACRSYGTGESTIALQPFDFPKFGDDTFVAQVTGSTPGGESHGAIVYVRVDNRVSSIVSVTFSESAVNQELIEHLADLVADRMQTKPELGDLPDG